MSLLGKVVRRASLPEVLWHGSAYDTDVLKPGFLWTKKLVQWDHGESNHYLYATTDRHTAVQLGFASAIEKRFALDRFRTTERGIEITSPDAITHYDLEKLRVWLYEIHPQSEQEWVHNHNTHNKLETEFKTHRTVPYRKRELLNLEYWLGAIEVKIIKS